MFRDVQLKSWNIGNYTKMHISYKNRLLWQIKVTHPPCRNYLQPLYLSMTLYACAQRVYSKAITSPTEFLNNLALSLTRSLALLLLQTHYWLTHLTQSIHSLTLLLSQSLTNSSLTQINHLLCSSTHFTHYLILLNHFTHLLYSLTLLTHLNLLTPFSHSDILLTHVLFIRGDFIFA